MNDTKFMLLIIGIMFVGLACMAGMVLGLEAIFGF